MYLIFSIEILVYFYLALSSKEFMDWFMYIFCLWVTGYYCWKYIHERIKSYKIVYVFLSNIIFSFILICKLLSLWFSNL